MTSRTIHAAAAAMRAGTLATLLATARTEPNPHFAELLKGPDMRAWDLQAKGIIDATEEEAVKLEHELAQRLHAVLSEPPFATFFSVLGTPSFHGDVHSTPPPDAPAVVESNQPPAPAAQPAPAAGIPVSVDPAAVEKLLAGLSPEQVAALAAMGEAVVKQGVVPVPAAPQEATPQ